MGKRANTKAATQGAKKAKTETVDPLFTSVSDAIMDSEQLPERVRAMLVEMMPFSLKYGSDERHELQSMAVDFMEQALTDKKAALGAAATKTDEDLKALKNSEAELEAAVTNGEKALVAQQEVVAAKKAALEQATEADKGSAATFKEKVKAVEDGAKKAAEMKDEKEAISAAFAEHFPPCQEGEAKAHYKKLEPFLKKIKIESTLLTALPSCCAKSKEKRGTFDHLVLTELDKAFQAQIAALADTVAAEGPASAQREADARTAEADHNEKKTAKETATADSQAADTQLTACENNLAAAKQAVEDFQPKLAEMTESLSKAQQASADFEAGPFTNFQTFKARIAAVPEEPEPAAEPEAPAEAPAEAEAEGAAEAAAAE